MKASEVRVCGWCLEEFIFRTSHAELRRPLMICDETFEPVICDNCLAGQNSAIVRTNPSLGV